MVPKANGSPPDSAGSDLDRQVEHRVGGPLLSAAVAFGLFFLLAMAGTFGRPNYRTRPALQPIPFNHRVHVEQKTLSCPSCHPFVGQSGWSGLPETEVCTNCHLTPQGESAAAANLMARLTRGDTLTWIPLFRQPPHVFFPHRRHIAVAELECSACHGEIGDSTSPPLRVTRLGMQDCIECHDRSNARTDCTTCHR
jgi:hypothetical protein